MNNQYIHEENAQLAKRLCNNEWKSAIKIGIPSHTLEYLHRQKLLDRRKTTRSNGAIVLEYKLT